MADMAVKTKTGKNRGFTLLELMIVLTIIAILVGISIPIYKAVILRTREATLKMNLHSMREVIDQYTADKKKAPQALQDLVDAGYFRELPWDPMTDSNTTWQASYDTALSSPDQTDSGISDVHSGASGVGTDGSPYNTW
jgi:general secretion pathway protein G